MIQRKLKSGNLMPIKCSIKLLRAKIIIATTSLLPLPQRNHEIDTLTNIN